MVSFRRFFFSLLQCSLSILPDFTLTAPTSCKTSSPRKKQKQFLTSTEQRLRNDSRGRCTRTGWSANATRSGATSRGRNRPRCHRSSASSRRFPLFLPFVYVSAATFSFRPTAFLFRRLGGFPARLVFTFVPPAFSSPLRLPLPLPSEEVRRRSPHGAEEH